MLNTNAFKVLAGDPSKWDEETVRRCRPGCYAGTYNSEDICKVQVEQHFRGRKSASVWETVFGWALGYTSNLDNRAVLRGGRREPHLSKDDAIRLGIEWANQDPTNREFYVRIDDLKGTEWEG
jgi:hypothetical protein